MEPAASLMVGDSWESDIVGALGVGMTAVLVDRYSRRLEATCPRIATLDDVRFEEVHER